MGDRLAQVPRSVPPPSGLSSGGSRSETSDFEGGPVLHNQTPPHSRNSRNSCASGACAARAKFPPIFASGAGAEFPPICASSGNATRAEPPPICASGSAARAAPPAPTQSEKFQAFRIPMLSCVFVRNQTCDKVCKLHGIRKNENNTRQNRPKISAQSKRYTGGDYRFFDFFNYRGWTKVFPFFLSFPGPLLNQKTKKKDSYSVAHFF